jgi:hypothetical protein
VSKQHLQQQTANTNHIKQKGSLQARRCSYHPQRPVMQLTTLTVAYCIQLNVHDVASGAHRWWRKPVLLLLLLLAAEQEGA